MKKIISLAVVLMFALTTVLAGCASSETPSGTNNAASGGSGDASADHNGEVIHLKFWGAVPAGIGSAGGSR